MKNEIFKCAISELNSPVNTPPTNKGIDGNILVSI